MKPTSFKIIAGVALVMCLMLCSSGLLRLNADSILHYSPIKILENVTSIAFSPDGKTLALGGDVIRLWDLSTLTERSVLPFGGKVEAFSPDGRFLAMHSQGLNPLRVWDMQAAREIPVPLIGAPQFSADGSLLTGFNCYVGDSKYNTDDSQLASYTWDLLLGGIVDNAPCDSASRMSGVNTIGGVGDEYFSISPDGRLRARSSVILLDNAVSTLRVLEIETNTVIVSLANIIGPVMFSADGKTLASLDTGLSLTDGDSLPSKIHLFDVETWQEIAVLDGLPREGGSGLAFSPDNQFLACVCADGSVILWKLDSIIPTIAITPVTPVSLPTDTAEIKAFVLDRLAQHGTVMQSADGTAALMVNWSSLWHYRLDTSLSLPRPVFQGDPTMGYGGTGLRLETLNADQSILIAQYGFGPLMAWDTATGAPLYTVSPGGGSIWALSPDGEYLVAIHAREWHGYVWETRTGADIASWSFQDDTQDERSTRGQLEKIVFSPDGRVVALSSTFYEGGPSYNQLRLMQFPAGQRLAVYIIDGGGRDRPVVFSADGRTVSYGGRAWEIPSQ